MTRPCGLRRGHLQMKVAGVSVQTPHYRTVRDEPFRHARLKTIGDKKPTHTFVCVRLLECRGLNPGRSKRPADGAKVAATSPSERSQKCVKKRTEVFAKMTSLRLSTKQISTNANAPVADRPTLQAPTTHPDHSGRSSASRGYRHPRAPHAPVPPCASSVPRCALPPY